MTGWNLPPGVTDADIDRAFGGSEPWACGNCGAENEYGTDECHDCGEYFDPALEDELDARIDWEMDRDR